MPAPSTDAIKLSTCRCRTFFINLRYKELRLFVLKITGQNGDRYKNYTHFLDGKEIDAF
jgi:hypothetical protein